MSSIKATLSIILKACLRATEIRRKSAPSELDNGKLKGSTIGVIANHSSLVLPKLLHVKYKAGINI